MITFCCFSMSRCIGALKDRTKAKAEMLALGVRPDTLDADTVGTCIAIIGHKQGCRKINWFLIFIKKHFDFLRTSKSFFVILISNWSSSNFLPAKWFRLILLQNCWFSNRIFVFFLQKTHDLIAKNDFDFLLKTELIFWFFWKSKNHLKNDFDFWLILPYKILEMIFIKIKKSIFLQPWYKQHTSPSDKDPSCAQLWVTLVTRGGRLILIFPKMTKTVHNNP